MATMKEPAHKLIGFSALSKLSPERLPLSPRPQHGPALSTAPHFNNFRFFFSYENKLEFGFWVLRYVVTFVAFLTGMKAPGILSATEISGEGDTEVLAYFCPSLYRHGRKTAGI